MATAQYYVARRRAHGYELVQVRPSDASGQWWTIGGTMLTFFGLRRRTLPGLALMGAGIAMICKGNRQNTECRKDVGFLAPTDESADAEQESALGPSYQNDREGPRGQVASDLVEEASMQSFPASDPPSYLRSE